MSKSYSLTVQNQIGVTTPFTWGICTKNTGANTLNCLPGTYHQGDTVYLKSDSDSGYVSINRSNQQCNVSFANLANKGQTWTLTSNSSFAGVTCDTSVAMMSANAPSK